MWSRLGGNSAATYLLIGETLKTTVERNEIYRSINK